MTLPDQAVSAQNFERLAHGLIPAREGLAVAVSGGADSMALVRLAAALARHHKVRLTALTVDHGLRPESAAEARKVGMWMRGLGIAHHILLWTGPKPSSGIQATARLARYGLLCKWCRDHHVETMLVGHHRDDQAETYLMRLGRGSGPHGLAAMPVEMTRDGVRIVRPLLAVPKSRLVATCSALGQDWIEDPSNQNPFYGRARARKRLAANRDGAAIAEMTRVYGLARAARVRKVGDLLDRAATEYAEGYVRLSRRMLADAPRRVAEAALARTLCRVSGAVHGPRTTSLRALLRALVNPRPRTRSLHRCLIIADTDTATDLLVCRESRNLPSQALRPGDELLWDRRFRVALDARTPVENATVGALAVDGWSQIRAGCPQSMPSQIRDVLPALWRGGQVISAPLLGFGGEHVGFSVKFSATLTLVPEPFAVVSPGETPIFRGINPAGGLRTAESPQDGGDFQANASSWNA